MNENGIKTKKASIKSITKLSSLQSGILFESIENKSLYINQLVIKNIYDEEIIKRSLSILKKNHPLLTCNVLYEKVDNPRIVFFNNKEIQYTKSECNTSEQYDAILEKELQSIDDLQRKPLFRVNLVKTENGQTLLVWTYHHIILDGWSVDLLYNEFVEIWKTLLSGSAYNKEYTDEIVQYNSFLSYIQTADKEKSVSYWSKLLDGYENFNVLPFHSKVERKSFSSKSSIHFSDINLLDGLNKTAKKYGFTVSNLLETAWGLLLAEYSTENDIVFGKVVSVRNAPVDNIENQVGFFINTVPFRIQFNDEESLLDLIKRSNKNSIDSMEYCCCSLVDIQKAINHNGLINTTYSFENYDVENNDNQSCKVTYEEVKESTSCPINLSISINSDRLRIRITYDEKLYSELEIKNIYYKFIFILGIITEKTESSIKDLDFTTDEEKQILDTFNSTDQKYDLNKNVIELFEQQVEKNPDKTAVVFNGQEFTYDQFNKRANRLAHRLREQYNIKADDMIPIIAQRSVEMLVGIYAIIKSGAAYVPIDPNYPDERISFIIDDCKAKVVLSYKSDVNIDRPVLHIDDPDSYSDNENNLNKISGPDNLIYCLYTSGTTGKPKGVMNVNRGLTNVMNWIQCTYPITSDDAVLFKTTYTFDLSFWEIAWWGIAGAKIVILPPNDEKDPVKIARTIENDDITVVTFVPSMLNAFLSTIKSQGRNIDFNKLKYLITIGEPLTSKTVDNSYEILFQNNDEVKIINTYGPTESAIAVTSYDCRREDTFISIGKPMSNIKIYIIKNDRLCGIGVPGELCIVGDGLARGYLNRDDLTNSKFIECPVDGKRMYRTGDLARWMSDGNIFYLGREDDQVKIRGCRVELSEIENRIREIDYVKDCAVVAKKGKYSENSVYAYIVSDQTVDISDLKKKLKNKLPEYMVPTYMAQIDKIPTMINGKVNRRLLPEITNQDVHEYVAPGNETESFLEELFCDILNLSKCSITDSFFDLGGDSLKCINLINRINEKMNVKISVSDIFSNSTIAELSIIFNNMDKNEYVPISEVEERESYNMSSTQKRMYLLHEMDRKSLAYNIPQMFRLKGNMDCNKMKSALEKMIDRYEILRTKFIVEDEEFLQVISKEVNVDFEYEEASDQSDEVIFKQFVRPFDLEKAPLFRVKMVQREGYVLLMMDSHHIISDGTSMKEFLRKLSEFYNS